MSERRNYRQCPDMKCIHRWYEKTKNCPRCGKKWYPYPHGISEEWDGSEDENGEDHEPEDE